MNVSAEQPMLDPRFRPWIASVASYWERRGVSEADQTRLRAELERDLSLAVLEGAAVEDLIDADPSEFARELAEANGLTDASGRTDPTLTTTTFVVTAMVGAMVGAIASALLLYPLGVQVLDGLPLTYSGEGVFAVGLHVVASCICAAFAAGALRWRFRRHAKINRTALIAGGFLLLGGAASVAPTMALAASLNYNNTAPVVLMEVGIVLAFCIAGLLAGQWVRTRTTRREGA